MKKRRRHHAMKNIGRLLRYLVILAAAAGMGFAAMMFYFRLPDEELANHYMRCIAEGRFAEAYEDLYLPEKSSGLDAEHFAVFAEDFYKEGTYDIKRAADSSAEAPVFTAISEGNFDRQFVTLKLVKDETDTWKVAAEDLLSVLHAEVPAEFSLVLERETVAEAKEEIFEAEFPVFAADYTLTYVSGIYEDSNVDVPAKQIRDGKTVQLKDTAFVLKPEEQEGLQDFAERLGRTYVQDICNGITVYTVLDPYGHPVYDGQAKDKIGGYYPADFDPAIPWQIELEEGCRSTFYRVFAETYRTIPAEGSFALNKTLVSDADASLTNTQCSAEKQEYLFEYTVLLEAEYSEDYYDTGAGEIKNSRTEQRGYSLNVTYSRHDGRWWVRSVSKPVRTS